MNPFPRKCAVYMKQSTHLKMSCKSPKFEINNSLVVVVGCCCCCCWHVCGPRGSVGSNCFEDSTMPGAKRATCNRDCRLYSVRIDEEWVARVSEYS